jgi:uncharacterized protein YndB with AHSA1/START domain
MPQQKDLKRVVRARMQKTGESYTAARVHVLAKRDSAAAKKTSTPESGGTRKRAAAKPVEPKPDYAGLAGMSDATIKARTGCDWERWVKHLDHWGAADKTHREIAAHVHEKFGVPEWWTQSVTVGYERIKGLRAIGQRRSGVYETSKSKTIAVPLAKLYAAWATPAARKRWLPGVKLTVRKANADKSMRITWDDGTSVEVGFFAKGAAKSMVAVQHGKLSDRARADELKRFWGERLDALAASLTAGAKG